MSYFFFDAGKTKIVFKYRKNYSVHILFILPEFIIKVNCNRCPELTFRQVIQIG